MNKPDNTAWKQKLQAFMDKIKTASRGQSLKEWVSTHKEITILGGLLVVLLIVAAATSGNESSDTKESVNETITIIGNSKTTAEAELDEGETHQEITALINRYFTALAACDIETLNNICETAEPFDAEVLAEHASYIQGYRNVDCTIMDGLVEGTYVVYAYYEMKFYYIDTPAPALVQLYIKTGEDQMPYIYQGVIDGELSAYIAELTASQEISGLADEVNKKLQIACAADPDLDTFIRVLQNQTQSRSVEESSHSSAEQEDTSGQTDESTDEENSNLD